MTTEVVSAVELAARIRAGELTAVEAVEAAFAAIDRRDGEIGAFVALARERALAEAAEIRPGDPRPLCGVPFGVKDLFAATDGLPTTNGSAAFGDWVAGHDSTHVARLRAAGAILVGKTKTCELGLRPVTEPARYGPTRNPRDPRLTAGGSSGGSAAAVAAGMVPLCDGSDAGGSIRIPAACCGVVGMRPTRGVVPSDADLDATGMSHIATYGPIARTVADAAAALAVMAADDRLTDPEAPEHVPVRVASAAPLGVPVDAEPRAAAERAANALAGLGHDVGEGTPDWDDEEFPTAWETLGAAGVRKLAEMLQRQNGRPLDPAALEPKTRELLVEMPPVPHAARADAEKRLSAFAERVLSSWPPGSILLTPTLTRLPVEVNTLTAQVGPSVEGVRFSAFLRIFNVTGQPAITIPAGDTVGVQLVGPPGRDDLVLALAAQLERALQR